MNNLALPQFERSRRACNRRSIGASTACVALIVLSSALASLAAPPWSQPVKLSRQTSNAESPSVAINNSGEMVGVWSQQQGVSYNVQAAVNLNGTWTHG